MTAKSTHINSYAQGYVVHTPKLRPNAPKLCPNTTQLPLLAPQLYPIVRSTASTALQDVTINFAVHNQGLRGSKMEVAHLLRHGPREVIS